MAYSFFGVKRLSLTVSVTMVLAIGCGDAATTVSMTDPLATSVSNEELAGLLEQLDSASLFNSVGRTWLLADSQTTALIYLPSVRQTEEQARVGVVVARIEVSADYRFGLRRGINYLWMDHYGPAPNYWRGIMISADGSSRTVVKFKYTPGEQHRDATSPRSHAATYCNGAFGCFFVTQGPDGVQETVWQGCVDGCCEIEDP
jgi:hypothetical protein